MDNKLCNDSDPASKLKRLCHRIAEKAKKPDTQGNTLNCFKTLTIYFIYTSVLLID